MKAVTLNEITKKWGMAQYNNSQVTTNGSNNHEINRRYNNLDKDEGDDQAH